jgi:hypothetical protein
MKKKNATLKPIRNTRTGKIDSLDITVTETFRGNDLNKDILPAADRLNKIVKRLVSKLSRLRPYHNHRNSSITVQPRQVVLHTTIRIDPISEQELSKLQL